MITRRKLAALLLLLPVCGSSGCAPKELFSFIDRNCFIADWTNHHSCLSCCGCGNCQHARAKVQYEMLVLGNHPTVVPGSETISQPVELGRASPPID